ncbi:hypothetical protein AAFF39_03660 [Lactococcus garvieae]
MTAEEMNIVKNNEAEVMKSEINSLQISGDKKQRFKQQYMGRLTLLLRNN